MALQLFFPSTSVRFSWDTPTTKEARSFLYGTRHMWVGAVAGPPVVGLLTPQRNAMTLSAKDLTSTYTGLYRRVFSQGIMQGFRGASAPVIAAVPSFSAIGPVYLAAERSTGSVSAAILTASAVESAFAFSAERANAVAQYNALQSKSKQIQMPSARHFMGPGFMSHIGRNATAMVGIRVISPHAQVGVRRAAPQLSEEKVQVVSDLASSVVAASLSMPFNHIFSWSVCTPQLAQMSAFERVKASCNFLMHTYKAQGTRLLTRDLCVRISYTGLLFTSYRFLERRVVS